MSATNLTYGSGFGGASAWLPGQIGSADDPGGTATVIARECFAFYRDCDETTNGLFYFGLIAAHINGIDYVNASFADGPTGVANKLTINPRTNAWEYCFTIDPTSVGVAGMYEIKFEIVPRSAGVSRVITAFLWIDPGQMYARPVRYIDPANSTGLAANTNNGKTRTTPWLTMAAVATIEGDTDQAFHFKLMSAGFQLLQYISGFTNNEQVVKITPDDGLTGADVKWAQSPVSTRLRRWRAEGWRTYEGAIADGWKDDRE